MAKILLIISALVIAATAYLGFATKQKVDTIQGNLSDKTKSLSAAQSDLGKAKGNLKKAEEELVTTKADLEQKEKDIAAEKGKADKLGSDLKQASESLAAKTEELDKLRAAMPNKPGEGPVDVEQMKTRLEEMQRSKTELEGRVAELTQIQDTLNKKASEATATAAAAQSQVQAYKSEYTRPGITGTVLAYNPGWNFVVLNIGDRQSLKAGKVLVVTRDGRMVGKVRVTSVEPSSSIADVLPSTVPKGESVQPGDRVVYETRGK